MLHILLLLPGVTGSGNIIDDYDLYMQQGMHDPSVMVLTDYRHYGVVTNDTDDRFGVTVNYQALLTLQKQITVGFKWFQTWISSRWSVVQGVLPVLAITRWTFRGHPN